MCLNQTHEYVNGLFQITEASSSPEKSPEKSLCWSSIFTVTGISKLFCRWKAKAPVSDVSSVWSMVVYKGRPLDGVSSSCFQFFVG